MKSLYVFGDTRTGCFGEPVVFCSDRHARAVMFDIITREDFPSHYANDAILYRISDYDDTNGCPVLYPLDNPVIVMRGSEEYVQNALAKASEDASD